MCPSLFKYIEEDEATTNRNYLLLIKNEVEFLHIIFDKCSIICLVVWCGFLTLF